MTWLSGLSICLHMLTSERLLNGASNLLRNANCSGLGTYLRVELGSFIFIFIIPPLIDK